jgi:HPt (histidine-containing phosphotransfer) domain-containing protein
MDRVRSAGPPRNRPQPALLDARVLVAACGNDAGILEKICQTFRARLPGHLQAVQEALRDHDAPRLREAAHKLAGMVAAFSTVAGRVASDLEDLAAAGQLDEAQPLVNKLAAMSEELFQMADGLSLEMLRRHTGPAEERNQRDG